MNEYMSQALQQRKEYLVRAERAEAERDALRAALEQIAHGIPGLTPFAAIARAALNPSVREE